MCGCSAAIAHAACAASCPHPMVQCRPCRSAHVTLHAWTHHHQHTVIAPFGLYAATPLVTSVCKQRLDWDVTRRALGPAAEHCTRACNTEQQLGVVVFTQRGPGRLHRSTEHGSLCPQIFIALYFGHCLAPANQPLSCCTPGMPHAGSTLPDGQFCDRWSVAMLAVLAAAHPPQPSSA